MDRNPHLEEVTHTAAEAKAVARVQGLADVKVTEHTTIQPERIIVRYVYSLGGFWRANRVSLSGPRVLKPGPNGERRLGQTIGEREWYGYAEDLARDDVTSSWGKLDPEVKDLIERLRPTGVLKLPVV